MAHLHCSLTPQHQRSQQGFTLIELLMVISIIGILSLLSLTAFYVYKADAAYGVVQKTLRDAKTAIHASASDVDNPIGAVPLTSQNVPGPLSDPGAADFLPGFTVPKSVKFETSYDPGCTTGACTAEFLQVRHCLGQEYSQFVRFGDGLELTLEHIAGTGCP